MLRRLGGSKPCRRGFVRWIALVATAASTAAIGAEEPSRPAGTAPRHAFVTSLDYSANLGGLAGADALCQARATAAGLANPTGFVAWLSDTVDDAYCRINGLTGKRSANCGQAQLPVAAGPWVRVDGAPFAQRIDLALDGKQVLTPLRIDESGADVGTGIAAWTATSGSGEFHPTWTDCGGWLSNAGPAMAATGSTAGTSGSWTTTGATSCTLTSRLFCLEKGSAAPLPPHHSPGALAFVTSAFGSGDLSSWGFGGNGLAAGDAICQSLAATAGLPAPGSFVAWLSTDSVDAIDRLSLDGPWIRLDGVRVADSKSDLTDGSLAAPINVTDTGAYYSARGVWTGTTAQGVAATAHCGEWTLDDATQGRSGVSSIAGSQFTFGAETACSTAAFHLYCLSNVAAMLLVDDFESSDTAAWSLAFP